ncbi:uncharacterized protein LOC109849670 [Asparagus officinalis]|nr:uncharacterized protein LOC109849670 [Asparagus officinalis]
MIKKMVENYGPAEGLRGMHTCPDIGRSGSNEEIHPVEAKRSKINTHINYAPGGFSPLGLRLTKTPSFAELIETKLCKQTPSALEKRMKRNKAHSSAEKLKACNMPAFSLQIGSWKRVASFDGDVVAKCYFSKQKLVWEVLCEGLKSKMEIQWLQISAIKATFIEGRPDSLKIELEKPPMYFRESSPQPRRHTMWVSGNDFTEGQAQIYRRHILQFPEGTLEKHYEKLLQCDPRLYELSQRPFPDLNSPFFDMIPIKQNIYYQQSGNLFQTQQVLHRVPLIANTSLISSPSRHTVPYQSTSSSINALNSVYSFPMGTIDRRNMSMAPNPVMNSQRSNKELSVHSVDPATSSGLDHNILVWNQGVQNIKDFTNLWNEQLDSIAHINQQSIGINSTAHKLFNEPQSPVKADEKSLLVKASSFGSTLCEFNGVAQEAPTPEDGEYNLSNPNMLMVPKVYNRIDVHGNGAHTLSDSSSSMEPIPCYQNTDILSDSFMFRP